MTKGYYIEITNNLLDSKHRKKMGTAVWEFMWCLDKITKIDDDELGWVYGGRPINLKEIREEIGITEPKISKNLNKLAGKGYLILRRTPYGLVIKVCKAKKRFAQKVKTDLTKRENPATLKGKSNIRQDTTMHNDKTIVIKDIKNLKRLDELKAPLLKKMSAFSNKEKAEIQEEFSAEIRPSGEI